MTRRPRWVVPFLRNFRQMPDNFRRAAQLSGVDRTNVYRYSYRCAAFAAEVRNIQIEAGVLVRDFGKADRSAA